MAPDDFWLILKCGFSEASSNYEAHASEAAGGGSVSTYNGGTTYSNNYSENTGNYVQGKITK